MDSLADVEILGLLQDSPSAAFVWVVHFQKSSQKVSVTLFRVRLDQQTHSSMYPFPIREVV